MNQVSYSKENNKLELYANDNVDIIFLISRNKTYRDVTYN